MRELKLILRGLLREPLFTLTAVLSLALGIGSNTAIFSILDQTLLRTMPFERPEEIVFLYHPGPVQGSMSTDEAGGPSFSYPMFRDLQKLQNAFTGLAGSRGASASISYKNQSSHGSAHLVSGNYFDVFGLKPAMGRLFTSGDDLRPGEHPLVVLSHGYWTSRFGADPDALNQPIIVNGYPMTIVGVAPRGFASERLGSTPDIFVPISMKKEITPDWNGLADRRDYWVTLIGRLKPGMTIAQAQGAMNSVYRGQLEIDERLLTNPSPSLLAQFKSKKLILMPGQHGRGGVREGGKATLSLLMGITGLVLLIACANVANLLLARSAARSREIAVRLALGASRGQLIRRLLLESCVLAIAGGLLGLAFAYATDKAIIASLPPSAGVSGFLNPSLDGRILLYCLGLSVFTGLAFGLFPALQSTRPDVAPALKDQAGQSTSTGGSNWFRKGLVTAQIAISLLLLISAGQFIKSLVNLTRIDLGIKVDHLLTFSLMPKLNKYSDERASIFYEQLSEKLAATPGVTMVSSARVPAIAGSSSSGNITVEGFTPLNDDAADSNLNAVGPGYFRTMGVALIAGREFTAADKLTAPKVAIVNEAFVKHFLPGRNPLGHRLMKGGSNHPVFDTEIAGVVKDTKYGDMREAPPRVLFTPYLQSKGQDHLYFYVRTGIEPEQVIGQIRRHVADLDPNLPVNEMKTMRAQLDENMFMERTLSALTGLFAGLATVLAAIGLYGVLAFNIARRTREIGIRMALGADAGQVRGLVAREVGVMLAIGTAIGVLAAAGTAKFVKSILFEMDPRDPAVYAGSALLLAAVALIAAYVPTRRATNIHPMTALRHE